MGVLRLSIDLRGNVIQSWMSDGMNRLECLILDEEKFKDENYDDTL